MSKEIKDVAEVLIDQLEKNREAARKTLFGTELKGLEIVVDNGFKKIINRLAGAAGLTLVGSTAQDESLAASQGGGPVKSFFGKKVEVPVQPEVQESDVTASKEELATLQDKVNNVGDKLPQMIFDDFVAVQRQKDGEVILRALGKRYEVAEFETAELNIQYFAQLQSGKEEADKVALAKEAATKPATKKPKPSTKKEDKPKDK